MLRQLSEVLFKCYIKVSRHGIKKNGKMIRRNRKTGRSFIGSNDAVLLCQEWLENRLRVEKLKQRFSDPIDCDVNLKAIFYFPKTVYFTKQNCRSQKVADLSNLYELPQDCMQEVGILKNDGFICSHDGSRRKPIEGTEYFLEIELTRFIE